jgi:acyl carrier protein
MAFNRETLLEYLDNEMGLYISEIDDETLLFSTALLDSFSMVELISFIEKEANIKMSPTDVNLDNLDSLSRILNFIERHSQ